MHEDGAGTSGQYLDSNLLLRPVVGQHQPLLPESNVVPIAHHDNACTFSSQSDSPASRGEAACRHTLRSAAQWNQPAFWGNDVGPKR